MIWKRVCLAANFTCSWLWAHSTIDPASIRRVTARLQRALVVTDVWLMPEISAHHLRNLREKDKSPRRNLDGDHRFDDCGVAGPGCFRRAPLPGTQPAAGRG